jgi:2,4-dienoyl-CoA reductase-like NADH-dependent reductase (Old Yellow Enzyme family)
MNAPTAASLVWTPGRIGKVEIRNRFVLTGHGTGMVVGGQAGEQLIAYYAERAKGGVGLIMLGTQQVHPTSPGLGHLLLNYDDTIIASLREIATAVHRHGGRIFGYVGHFGAQAATRPAPPWSASALCDETRGELSHAMTEEEMAEIAAAHAAAAARNIEAGLDGIEVHGGHGLLLHQFLSPWSNRRTDAYGGSVENRLRFPAAVIRAVRERIGPDIPLGMRLSGEETVEGGLTLADMRIIVPRLVQAGGLDYVDVSAGNDRHAVSNMLHHPPMGLPPKPYAHLAKAIRAEIGVPVIHGTRVNTAAVGEAMLAAGEADFVGMCRALIADPHLPNKYRAGKALDTVPCVACEQACIGHLERRQAIGCVGNPVTGREAAGWGSLTAAHAARRVAVVGAGPAGMEAASVAASRGHEVLVIERQPVPGGLLRLAAQAPGRDEWLSLIEHKQRRMESTVAEVRYATEATPALIRAWRPDVVILATGSREQPPALTGAAEPHVIAHRNLFAGATVAGTVLVVDQTNRQQGVSTALLLAGRGHPVTVATAGPRVGHLLESPNFTRAQQLLALADVTTVPDFALSGIEGHRALGRHVFTGAALAIGPYDTIVLVTHGTPLADLAEALAGTVELRRIGDCVAPRDVEAAILDGHRVGREL